MTKVCASCGMVLAWPKIFSCFYCQKTYCDKHRIAESHECPKVAAAKHIEKDYLRRKGVNISSGRYAAVCKQCGFSSEYEDIEVANQKRIDHIKQKGCDSQMVQLRQSEEDKVQEQAIIESASSAIETASIDWMTESLDAAKAIIIKSHTDPRSEEFFKTTSYSLFVQHDRPDAYGYVYPVNGSSHFRIGIHSALAEKNPGNQRMIVVILIHELLHALYPQWGHDRINPLERLLANKANYFNALVDLEYLAVSGKMRFCDSH